MNKSILDINKINLNKRTCMVCSSASPLSEWVNDKCPACKQKYLPADNAAICPNCGYLTKKTDIHNGRCEKCQT